MDCAAHGPQCHNDALQRPQAPPRDVVCDHGACNPGALAVTATGDDVQATQRKLPRITRAIAPATHTFPMRLFCSCLFLLTVAAPLAAQRDTTRLLARARAIHRAVPMMDGHNDLPGAIRDRAHSDLSRMDPEHTLPDIDTDFPRMKRGMVGAQFWSAYVPASLVNGGGATYALQQIDLIHRMVVHSPSLRFARTADDIVRLHRQGRIASLIGIEGGYAIENSLANVRMFAALGVRYMTLTHGSNTAWADAATDSAVHGGLTSFGEAVVREMNRAGVMVDLSHVSDGTMSDALRVSEAPVIFSHSSARAVTNHLRNVPDSILALLHRNDGIVMVNIFPGFINATAAKQAAGALEKEREFLAKYPGDPRRASDEFLAWLTNMMSTMESGTLSEVADHIDHLVRIAGVDHVGYGADYGEISNHPRGLEDVSRYPYLTAELLRRGYSDQDVGRIIGGNMLRVMRRVEAVASRLQTSRAPDVTEMAAPARP
jgi:membrane dipeptidase